MIALSLSALAAPASLAALLLATVAVIWSLVEDLPPAASADAEAEILLRVHGWM
jgi:hypothetical protein